MLFSYGCDSGSTGGSEDSSESNPAPTDDQPNASFDLTLSSYAKNNASTNPSSANNTLPLKSENSLESLRLLTGTILVINQGTKVEEQYNWALYIDENAIEIQAEISLPLENGAYDFYFLMTTGQDQYAAITNNWVILDGQNAIPFLIHPVIGDFIEKN